MLVLVIPESSILAFSAASLSLCIAISVLGKVYAGIPFEVFYQPINNLVIEVVAAEVGIAVGGKHFEHAVAYFEYGYIERAAAEVVNHNLLAAFLLIEAVGERRRGGFVYYTKHVEAGDFARVFGGLTLRIVEVCGAGDYRVGNLAAEIAFGIGFELGKNHSRNFLGRIALIYIYLVGFAHMPLYRNNRFIGLGNGEPLGRLAYDTGCRQP